MATLGASYPTLLELSKQFTSDGTALPMAELLSQDNEVLMDMPYVESNLATGHRISQRTGLPTAAFRKLNRGTPVSKSTYADVTEGSAMLEAWGDVDQKLAELNGNTAKFRMNQNIGHMQAMNIAQATNLFYGNAALDPEKYTGLSPRYSSLSTATAESADNVITGGGSANLTSIWLVGWGEHTIYGHYPKGSQVGLKHEDLGLDTILDSSSNPYRAYRDRFCWDGGLAVQDWRYAVRIPNIDVTAVTKNAATGADLTDLMMIAMERLYSQSGVRPVFYMNRTLRSFLRRQVVNKTANSTLSADSVLGTEVLSLSGVPIRRTDALLNTESVVS